MLALFIVLILFLIILCIQYLINIITEKKELKSYKYIEYKKLIDSELQKYFTDRNNEIDNCCYYSTHKGKRIRPIIILEIIRKNGYDPKSYLNEAISLELIHNASLIMDDLPSQDNDEFRRGEESSWKKYDVSTAQLSGVYLMSKSIENTVKYPEQMKYLSKYLKDTVEGQYLDLKKDINDVNKVLKLKTASLFEAATVSGCILSKQQQNMDKYIELGYNLGMAYQIGDDIGDIKKNDNINYAKIKGCNKAYYDLTNYINNAISILKDLNIYSDVWDEIIKIIYDMSSSE